MNPEENELRRALDARSGAPSPEFRSRLRQALATRPAVPNLMPAIALATVVVLTATSVAILVGARHLGRGTAASGARATSPTPIPAGGFKFQLSAPSAGVVWALYDPDKLYRSTDGGTSWDVRSMPSQQGVHPVISFINDREGWWLAPTPPTLECGVQVVDIWHTTDGAASWQNLGYSVDKTSCKDGIWFVDAKHGFVSAWDESHQPAVYYTSDGGVHWRFSTLADPADFKTMAGGFTLRVQWLKQFGSTLYLLAYGMQGAGSPYPEIPNRQYIYRSVDGGASWTVLTKVQSRSVVMVTESRWLDLEGHGQSMESTNGGQQFHQFSSNYVADSASADTQFVFADSRVGYAATAGHLQRTTDGGLDWTGLAPPGLGNVKGSPAPLPSPSQSPGAAPMPTDARISAPSPDVVWALVAGQRLFRSTDQGLTWQEHNLPAGSLFSDISFVDESDGWVLRGGPSAGQCSYGGATVWQTTDAGSSWNIVSQVNPPPASGERSAAGAIGFAQCKDNISFADKQRGFLDAWDENSAPTIYRTFDGGVTWSSSKLTDPPGFRTLGAGDALRVGPVKAFGAMLLVAAGGMQPDGPHTYAFQSTDGGATWTYTATIATTATINFAFGTATRWLVLNNDGSGQETLDAGKTWHAFTSDYNDAAGVASTFVFVDGRIGYGTVRGEIRLTTDGGSHWSLIKTSWP